MVTTHRPHQRPASLLRISNDEEQMNSKLEVGKKCKVGAILSYTQKKKKSRRKNEKHKGAGLPEYEAKAIKEMDGILAYNRSFKTDVPYSVLDEAMKEAIQARDLVQMRNKEGGKSHHKLSFRCHQQQWTFIWIYEKEVTPRENQAGGITVCSLDPGVRTFYIGNQDAQRIIRLCLHLDDLISRTIKARANKPLWLDCIFDAIIIPPFNGDQMSRKQHRRKMMSLAHGRFLERLISKAEEFGKEVKIVGEEGSRMSHDVNSDVNKRGLGHQVST
ncbi:4284_t:CDS:2 [Diversispora eburnea]|uniref:4284_t:CDS:1 n=1 Tax=Diversispora eburnea TaxID=1213867 RepID=A0A9N9BAG5_9GLOM|nr:4284_t:CDS:2 [Diversispora eburnea]